MNRPSVIQENPLAKNIARYSLPLVMMVFYLTASIGFDYTPDSTYAALQFSRDTFQRGTPTESIIGTPSPLWLAIQGMGRILSIDVLLVSKVFSLFFSSLAILFVFLLGFEVLADRLLAIAASLVFAMQPWLMQAAPSGSSFGLGLSLGLATLFFLMRNEYLIATIFSGLCTLVFWEGAGLFALIVVDIYLNSVDRQRAVRLVGGMVSVYAAAILPWILAARFFNAPLLPVLVPLDEFPALSFGAISVLILLVGLTLMGILLGRTSSVEGNKIIRGQVSMYMWIAVLLLFGVAGSSEICLMSIPLFIILAIQGLKNLLVKFGKAQLVYVTAFCFVVLLVAQSQFDWFTITRPAMNRYYESSEEMRSISEWLTVNGNSSGAVTAEKSGLLGYYLNNPIIAMSGTATYSSEFVVTIESNVPGYRPVFSARTDQPDSKGNHLVVWKKN